MKLETFALIKTIRQNLTAIEIEAGASYPETPNVPTLTAAIVDGQKAWEMLFTHLSDMYQFETEKEL